MLRLTSRAMAQLAVQRLLAAQLIVHLAAMAAGLIADLEVLIRLMYPVRRPLLPLMDTSRAGLGIGIGVHPGRAGRKTPPFVPAVVRHAAIPLGEDGDVTLERRRRTAGSLRMCVLEAELVEGDGEGDRS